MPFRNFPDLYSAPDPWLWLQASYLNTGGEDGLYRSIYGQIIPVLLRYADGSQVEDSYAAHPWLTDFEPGNELRDSLASFNRDKNQTTIALIAHLEAVANGMVFIKLRSHCREFVEVFAADIASRNDGPISSEDIGLVCEALIAALIDFQNDRHWDYVCERVGEFCLLAGSPQKHPSPFESVHELRRAIVRPSPSDRETTLLTEISQLKEQNERYEQQIRSQSRVITCLSYRYLLEHLPGPAPANVSNTAHWQTFWSNALLNAASSRTHPLAPLFDRFGRDNRTYRQIQQAGSDLYDTLSTNIHHFRGGYVIASNQWDELPGSILQSLTPAHLNSDGSVDWAAERSRY